MVNTQTFWETEPPVFSRRVFLASLAVGGTTGAATLASGCIPFLRTTIADRIDGLGHVLTSTDPSLPHQLYVIGMAHRHPLTGVFSHEEGPQVHVEIYKILERLLRDEKVHLVLPEGHYVSVDYHQMYATKIAQMETSLRRHPELHQQIKAGNAEKLRGAFAVARPNVDERDQLYAWDFLRLNHPGVDVQGAESDDEHRLSMNFIQAGMDGRIDLPYEEARRILGENIGERRSAYMLGHAMSDVSVREKEMGRIPNRNAVIIIGNRHLDEIVHFVEQEHVLIEPEEVILDGERFELPGIDKKVNISALGYGVTVIQPRSFVG